MRKLTSFVDLGFCSASGQKQLLTRHWTSLSTPCFFTTKNIPAVLSGTTCEEVAVEWALFLIVMPIH